MAKNASNSPQILGAEKLTSEPYSSTVSEAAKDRNNVDEGDLRRSKFVHLHTHSHYSFLRALPKVPELVKAAKAADMGALGITDVGNMHGAVEFYKSAEKNGIKAILGVDAYLAPRSRFSKEHGEEGKHSTIVLLAENNVGYKNLLALITKSFTEGYLDRPRMDKELLREHSEGLIAIMPSFSGDVAQMLKGGDKDGASATLSEYVSIFGKDNIFLEITHHPKVDGHTKRMETMKQIAKESGVQLIAQHDVYYLKPADREATEVMRRIAHGVRGTNEEEDFSFVSEKLMREWFKDVPEAVDVSGTIADRCNVTLELGSWNFPAIETEDGKTHAQMLEEKTYAGLTMRGMERTEEVETRIKYELDVIISKGFAPYFLAVSDLLTYAKSVGILSTTRGSAAGSLVSYLTGITNVDPLFYKLPFERFLNPERPKAPDIDMDFADNRRDEMIAYAKRKYGDDKVAQIGTFGTLMARAAVRDVARALGHAYRMGDQLAKLIPLGSQGFAMTIERALTLEPELKKMYDEDDDARQILDLAQRIEGCVRHTGVHAAGVVIAPTPLTEWTPLQIDPKTEKLITQYDMHAVEDAGLLKFDFLGIKNLAILSDAIDRVRESRGMYIDIENIPLDDAKTFAMLARGETEGTFQLNGSGMTRYLKELQPTTIHDINAMVALYRPGPMETIPQYIERKKNQKLIRYIDPRMEEYLDASYGLLVYQDDVLLTAIKLGGYSWLEADTLRKAMGKKIPEEMEAQKEKLLKGFQDFGKLSKEKGLQLWKLIEPFAAYGFNKAHAACYGKVAYQTAYMKANYPVEYMAAVLTADSGDTESISIFVAECERMQIPVLPPDVNESNGDFTAVVGERTADTAAVGVKTADTIRFGLTTIKNFGEGISQAIINERTKNGPFKDLSDFLSRASGKSLNRKSLESLIKSGALDRFGERSHLLTHIETLLTFHRDATQEAPQDSLFGAGLFASPELKLPPSDRSTSLKDKLDWEKELLGIYVSGHPLDSHTDTSSKASTTIGEIQTNPHTGLTVILPVLVQEVRTILTKKGEKMAFVKFEDKTASIEGVVFPKIYTERGPFLQAGSCLLIKATVSNRNGEISLAIENLKAL
ncbi:MAG: polymerase subunit alpha, polymerase subunit alpha protein [Parcubacteria group bacterium]|nr:polymerase subunit alpha, polymerase subunit alpha protein [Parcubacteria group bacterium]